MKRKFYQITSSGRTADIDIYGDIESYAWRNNDVTAYDIKKEIDLLDVDEINVYINSYGGVVSEAVAIYSALRRNKANVHTYCDGFACSAATIIFAAGDIRTMGSLGLLMIHNCQSYLGYASSEEMRKAAEDNDKINQSSIEAYKRISNLPEEKIREMMDAETWMTAKEALEYGFATEIAENEEEGETMQSAMQTIRGAVLAGQENGQGKTMEKLDEILQAVNEIREQKAPQNKEPEDEKKQKTLEFLKNLI